ncbi:MAG: chloride channel protein [Cyanobacteria bacterium P01_A01_bin.84]
MFPLFITKYVRHFWQPRRSLAIAEASIIGIVAALSAVFLKFGSGWLGAIRVNSSYMLTPWFILPILGFSGGYLAGFLVERFAPEAAGGGIPQVKAALANVPVRLCWRIALVKLLSSIVTIGSGLSMGRQAPTIHVGAALAAGMSRIVPTSPDHRKQMIAAGAGAGVAAAFNAPIAGVMFVVEELLQDLSGLTLGTAIIASFIGGVVSRLLGGGSFNDLNLKVAESFSHFSIPEIPFYLLLGVLSGFFAALFHHGLLKSLELYKKFHIGLPLRVALAGLISGIIVSTLPLHFRDNTGLREFLIAGNSEIAPRVIIITSAIAFIFKFGLTLLAFGSGAPGGLFGPSLLLGSSLGYLVGSGASEVLQGITHEVISPVTYALAGMGAFFGGFSKAPITAIIIIFEITRDFNLVLPLMISVVTSYFVADKLAPGSLNNKLLEINGIKLKETASVEKILDKLTAENVMVSRVETLNADMTLKEAIKAFSYSHHRGFPVVRKDKLVGIITQSDLLKAEEGYFSQDMPIEKIMTPEPITVTPEHNLSNLLYILDRYLVSRLPVVEGNRLVGIITRGDIIAAQANYLNGENAPIGPQHEPSYMVYQTKAPSIGNGRILVPIVNPQTAPTLLQMATAIARDRNYEIECLQVIVVSRNTSPSEVTVNTNSSRQMLSLAENLAEKWNIPLHTQIRIAHDAARAILETINERHIDLILMGWKGKTSSPNKIFGNVVDTIIRQATCEIALVRLGKQIKSNKLGKGNLSSLSYAFRYPSFPLQFNRWLVPMAGGPNARAAIKLLPGLVTLGKDPQIWLTRVFKPNKTEPDMSVVEEAIRQLVRRHKLSTEVKSAPIQSNSVPTAIINVIKKEKFDVVIIGASREGMLKQAINVNIPEAIAKGVEECTVILVRGAISNT